MSDIDFYIGLVLVQGTDFWESVSQATVLALTSRPRRTTRENHFSFFFSCAPTRPRRTTPCQHLFPARPRRNVCAHAAHHDTGCVQVIIIFVVYFEMRTRDCWSSSHHHQKSFQRESHHYADAQLPWILCEDVRGCVMSVSGCGISVTSAMLGVWCLHLCVMPWGDA